MHNRLPHTYVPARTTSGKWNSFIITNRIPVKNALNRNHYTTGMIQQPDGKIIAAGSLLIRKADQFALARFTAAG